jgi:TatD DNase family protein
MLGIGGPVTYKKSTQAEVVGFIGIDHILLETDSPYLSPVPYRGKRNESSYIRAINEKVASILGISPEETALITYRNSSKLFGLEY